MNSILVFIAVYASVLTIHILYGRWQERKCMVFGEYAKEADQESELLMNYYVSKSHLIAQYVDRKTFADLVDHKILYDISKSEIFRRSRSLRRLIDQYVTKSLASEKQ